MFTCAAAPGSEAAAASATMLSKILVCSTPMDSKLSPASYALS